MGKNVAFTFPIEEVETCMRKNTSEHIAFLASAAKRQRAEVKERNLPAANLRFFHDTKNQADHFMVSKSQKDR